MSYEISENGFTMKISYLDVGPVEDHGWYYSSYPKLKTPQGPYTQTEAEKKAREWANAW